MGKRNQLLSSKNNISSDIESLDIYYEDQDEALITEGDICIGTPITSFSFSEETNTDNKEVISVNEIISDNSMINPSTVVQNTQTTSRGQTPPIEGESFTLKRGYQLRPSTLRKLNELKTNHPDVNVHLNTILDAAILHYYDYILKENGKF